MDRQYAHYASSITVNPVPEYCCNCALQLILCGENNNYAVLLTSVTNDRNETVLFTKNHNSSQTK
jgi:hypothetical protein